MNQTHFLIRLARIQSAPSRRCHSHQVPFGKVTYVLFRDSIIVAEALFSFTVVHSFRLRTRNGSPHAQSEFFVYLYKVTLKSLWYCSSAIGHLSFCRMLFLLMPLLVSCYYICIFTTHFREILFWPKQVHEIRVLILTYGELAIQLYFS